MVKVKDLIEELKILDPELPVFWGISGLPCWIAKRDKTIKDFPMQFDLDWEGNGFMYFGDPADIEIKNNEIYSIRDHWMHKSLWGYLSWWIERTLRRY